MYKDAENDVASLGGGDKLEEFFFYKKEKKTDLVKYRTYKINNRKVIYYKNISEAERLSKKYLEAIENGSKGYTMEKYNSLVDGFGVIVLITNLTDEDAKTIYERYRYKNRWSIETYYDRLKNVTGFKELNVDDWATMQGVCHAPLRPY